MHERIGNPVRRQAAIVLRPVVQKHVSDYPPFYFRIAVLSHEGDRLYYGVHGVSVKRHSDVVLSWLGL